MRRMPGLGGVAAPRRCHGRAVRRRCPVCGKQRRLRAASCAGGTTRYGIPATRLAQVSSFMQSSNRQPNHGLFPRPGAFRLPCPGPMTRLRARGMTESPMPWNGRQGAAPSRRDVRQLEAGAFLTACRAFPCNPRMSAARVARSRSKTSSWPAVRSRTKSSTASREMTPIREALTWRSRRYAAGIRRSGRPSGPRTPCHCPQPFRPATCCWPRSRLPRADLHIPGRPGQVLRGRQQLAGAPCPAEDGNRGITRGLARGIARGVV